MTKKALVAGVTKTLSRAKLKIQKHSPEILVVTGVVGFVASAVMACKATTRAHEILEDTRVAVDKIHDCQERFSEPVEYVNEDGTTEIVEYTDEERKKDLAITYTKAGFRFAKLYGPSVLLGVASIGCVLMSHNILNKRNLALAAAYATVDKRFKEYQGRVLDRFGEKIERELRYGIASKTIEEVVKDEETGEETIVEKTVEVMEKPLGSPYAFLWDEVTAPDYCEKNAEFNFMFLRAEQNYANDYLRSHGHLFLNDVLKRLGLEPTAAGQVVGWVYDPENPEHKGNNYVDFGIYDMTRESTRYFVEGNERAVLLDFNVDGNIWELMKDPKRRHLFERK